MSQVSLPRGPLAASRVTLDWASVGDDLLGAARGALGQSSPEPAHPLEERLVEPLRLLERRRMPAPLEKDVGVPGELLGRRPRACRRQSSRTGRGRPGRTVSLPALRQVIGREELAVDTRDRGTSGSTPPHSQEPSYVGSNQIFGPFATYSRAKALREKGREDLACQLRQSASQDLLSLLGGVGLPEALVRRRGFIGPMRGAPTAPTPRTCSG